MNTEITKIRDAHWLQGWVLYDASCPSCHRFAQITEDLVTRRGFDLAPLQAPWVIECLDLCDHDRLSALRVMTVEGNSFTGADALIFLARRIWWAWPLAVAALLPGALPLLRRAYGLYASRRCQCDCAVHISKPLAKR